MPALTEAAIKRAAACVGLFAATACLILAACAASPSLAALPTNAHYRADMPSARVSGDVAAFDAAIDAMAAKNPEAVRKSPRSRSGSSRARQRGIAVNPVNPAKAAEAASPVPAHCEAAASATGPSAPIPPSKGGDRSAWRSNPSGLYLHPSKLLGLA